MANATLLNVNVNYILSENSRHLLPSMNIYVHVYTLCSKKVTPKFKSL